MKIALLFAASLSLLTTACAYQPHQETQVVDDRPQISFVWQYDNIEAEQAEVYVDGQRFGSVAEFAYPESSVPVLIGEHVIEVRHGTTVLYSKRDYFGESTSYKLEVGE
ncbi:hypothetical protein [Idiomarina sp. UBA3162]|uniref:hypothetical protein n=1 Tax=Idiomarina sp. UBA3162 TaxID=1946641 RepID=UPI000C937C9D|nr:hypothetical protein [Idiomarina sp. UBA3162]MAD52837.1 hypothetical protein [Idiomarinaceae bacterium]|tara:strand:- start:2279 stop:2605 length:327 start_codon:yes stop_codon:yes gene_type:complete